MKPRLVFALALLCSAAGVLAAPPAPAFHSAAPAALAPPASSSAETATVPLTNGFELPVGKGGSGVYHRARGFTPNGHLGEDWNGAGGGDTDFGDPIQACGTGRVMFAADYHLGWGNVVIIRHAYLEGDEVHFVDSLYGHLNEFFVKEGDIVQRGQQIGTMGNNHGMYDAHLHFEMRKNLAIGMNRSAFPRDFSCYYDPTQFILAHRDLPGTGRYVAMPIHTFNTNVLEPDALYAGPVTGPAAKPAPHSAAATTSHATPASTNNPRGPFKVDRFSDLRGGF